MRKQVAHSYLRACPSCGRSLKLSNKLGEKPSRCTSCDYFEPAGNAPFITFLSNCMSEYAHIQGVDTVFLKGRELTVNGCMEADCFLPLFVSRAEQIQVSSGLEGVKGLGLQVKVIKDVNGYIGSRVVMTSDSSINFAVNMSFLSEALHESINLTKSLKKPYYESELCLDYMLRENSVVDISGRKPAEQETPTSTLRRP